MATIEIGGVAIPESALTWNFVRALGSRRAEREQGRNGGGVPR